MAHPTSTPTYDGTAPAVGGPPVRVTYYDTAMALLEVGPLRLLTDPVFDAAGHTYDDGPVRLEKTGAPPVTPAALGRVDAVLLSHDQHSDNLDAAGRAFLADRARVPRVLTTPAAAARLLAAGVAAEGLAPWASTTLHGPGGFALTVTAAPARHGPPGTEDATGPVTGFLLHWPWAGDGAAVYVSGDTVPFAGTAEIARRAAPVGLALLHVGAARIAPLGDATLTLTAAEAAAYAAALGARHLAPLHFDGWRHFSESRAAAEAAFAASPIANRVTWLEPGRAHAFALDAS